MLHRGRTDISRQRCKFELVVASLPASSRPWLDGDTSFESFRGTSRRRILTNEVRWWPLGDRSSISVLYSIDCAGRLSLVFWRCASDSVFRIRLQYDGVAMATYGVLSTKIWRCDVGDNQVPKKRLLAIPSFELRCGYDTLREAYEDETRNRGIYVSLLVYLSSYLFWCSTCRTVRCGAMVIVVNSPNDHDDRSKKRECFLFPFESPYRLPHGRPIWPVCLPLTWWPFQTKNTLK
eukprot:scaffold8846_cov64-Cylindrotheca_fusiformis.AAC.1